jgi:DNA repair protein RecO (recombination protein O)
MNQKTRGIILHTTDYSETSLVVKIYTENAGMGSYIVSGVRTKKSRIKSNIFQPLSLVEMISSGKPGHGMKRITEIQLSPPLPHLTADVIKSSVALFLSEVIYRSVREESPNSSLFGFLHNGIQILDLSHEDCSRFHIYFMIQLSRHLGFYPNGTFVTGQSIFDIREGLFRNSPPHHVDFLSTVLSEKIFQLLNCSFENYHNIALSSPERKELLKSLVTFFEMHQTQGSNIRSHKVLEEVLH